MRYRLPARRQAFSGSASSLLPEHPVNIDRVSACPIVELLAGCDSVWVRRNCLFRAHPAGRARERAARHARAPIDALRALVGKKNDSSPDFQASNSVDYIAGRPPAAIKSGLRDD